MRSKINNSVSKLLRRSCLFLLVFFCMGAFAYGAEELYLKVGLSYNYNEVSSVKISCASGIAIGEISEAGWTETSSYEEIKTVHVSISNGIIQIKTEDGIVIVENLTRSQGVFPINKGEVIYANGDGYRGGYFFYPQGDNKMNLINYLELEDYVRGVVHSELSQSNPLEALKAQAICARSYAMCNLNRHSGAGYDICGSTHCQVYKGYKNEYPRTNQACIETKGLVIKYEGKVVPAYYSANSGGHTDNVEDIWPNKLGYLRGVRDEFSPMLSWGKTYTFKELASKLNQNGYSVGNISSINITERNISGTVAKLAIWDERKQTILSGNKLRSILGMNNIMSGMYSFSPIGPEDLEDALENPTSGVERPSTVTAKNLTGERSYSKTLQVVGKDGIIRDVVAGSLAIYNGVDMLLAKELDEETSDTLTPIINLGSESQLSSPITFHGLGWGHGVGMAQDSIKEMGKLGYDYKYMLEYFFTDITIEPWNN